MSSKLRWRITVGNLGAEVTGSDETQYRDDGEYDNMLIAGPVERHVLAHAFKESHERECAHYEKEGNED